MDLNHYFCFGKFMFVGTLKSNWIDIWSRISFTCGTIIAATWEELSDFQTRCRGQVHSFLEGDQMQGFWRIINFACADWNIFVASVSSCGEAKYMLKGFSDGKFHVRNSRKTITPTRVCSHSWKFHANSFLEASLILLSIDKISAYPDIKIANKIYFIYMYIPDDLQEISGWTIHLILVDRFFLIPLSMFKDITFFLFRTVQLLLT